MPYRKLAREMSDQMAADNERAALPVPDRPYEGELPLDAKDPSWKFDHLSSPEERFAIAMARQ